MTPTPLNALDDPDEPDPPRGGPGFVIAIGASAFLWALLALGGWLVYMVFS